MHFELSNKKDFFKSRQIVNLIVIGFITALVFGAALFDLEGNFKLEPFGLFFVLAFVISLLFFLKKQKTVKTFDVDELGIKTDSKTYSWEELKKFHLLGEAQSERFGTTKLVDLVNPYKHTQTQIFRIKTKKFINPWINLEIDKERVDELKNILTSHNVVHTSRWRLLVGV